MAFLCELSGEIQFFSNEFPFLRIELGIEANDLFPSSYGKYPDKYLLRLT